jgi:hypothetical protein
MKNETAFKNKVLKDLNRLPRTWVLKTQERSRRGVPDLLLSISGLFIAIELKDEGKEPTELQAAVLKRIRKTEAIAFHADPISWKLQFKQLRELADRLAA